MCVRGGVIGRLLQRFLLTFLITFSWPLTASAHIKWFNPNFNLMVPPRSLSQIAAETLFVPLLTLTFATIFFTALLDRQLWRWGALRSRLIAADAWSKDKVYPFLRALIGTFFLVLGWEGQVILTPESPSMASWVSGLQFLIAVTALFPATGVVAGIGILMLYGMCIEKLGLFHMLDYPAFIGAAVYLILPAIRRDLLGRGLIVLRVLTAASLMVGATEKFGYPSWSFKLLQDNPILTFGITDLEFYMVAAGMVEFALAYLILLGNVSARAAAALMVALMGSAIALFGWMDAVGHALFLASLLVLALERNPLERVFHFHGPTGTVRSALLISMLFSLVVIEAVCCYRLANIQLVTLCTTTPQGQHLHR